VRARETCWIAVLIFAWGATARAQDPNTPELTQDQAQKVDLSGDAKKESILPDVPLEAPPPPPRKKGFVVETQLGALGFVGKFGQIAPPAYWLHGQFGYEIFRWLMVFGEGELAFTTTGNEADATKSRAVPIFGFGGGARATIHFSDRVAIYAQGNLDAMMADVPYHALAVLGYSALESLAPVVGGRLGFEWYQMNPHIALALSGGSRFAPGFARTGGGDTSLLWDAEAGLRYTF
jgi:hypothetical protein